MQTGEASSASASSGPRRFSFTDPNRNSQDSPREQYHYSSSNSTKTLDLDSVWSIQKNVKVSSQTTRHKQLPVYQSSSETTNQNFYSRYTNNSGVDSRRSPSVPGSGRGRKGQGPPRSGPMYPARLEPASSDTDRWSAGSSAHSANSIGRTNSAGRGTAAREQGSYDPLADDF